MHHHNYIDLVRSKVRALMYGEGSGHDWWPVYRVWQLAWRIGRHERANLLVVELAALLHDIADWKDHGGDTEAGPSKTREIMNQCQIPDEAINRVCEIIGTMSFKGAGVPSPMTTLEGQIVQDADRLDALRAIGIARAFAYGGAKGRMIYDRDIDPVQHASADEYLKSIGTSVNHLYE